MRYLFLDQALDDEDLTVDVWLLVMSFGTLQCDVSTPQCESNQGKEVE